jgi:PAS domain S-box-containing protein
MSDSVRSVSSEISRESFELLLQILNHIEDPISIKNDCLKFIFANDALCARKGMPRELLLGKTLLELPLEDQAESAWLQENSVLETGENHTKEENLHDPEGSLRSQTTRIERITDQSGKRYILEITRDRAQNQSDHTHIPGSLPAKTHSAPPRAAIHDLNNLLNVIKGYTELLLEEIEADDPNRKDLEAISQAGDRAANLASKF